MELIIACINGDLETVMQSHEKCKNLGNDTIKNCLYITASNGHVNIIRYLIRMHNTLVTPKEFTYLMRLASTNGQLDMIKHLIEDYCVYTTIPYVKDKECKDKECKDTESKENKYDLRDAYSLSFWAACNNNHVKIAIYFLETIIVENLMKHDRTIIHDTYIHAYRTGKIEMVKYLYTKIYDVHVHSNALKQSCIHNHIDLVKYYIEECKIRIDEEMMEEACRNGSLEMIKYLLEKGEQISPISVQMVSCMNHVKVMEYLLELQVKIPSRNLYKCFKDADVRGYDDMSKLLLKLGRMNNYENDDTFYNKCITEFFEYACRRNNMSIIQFLIEEQYIDEEIVDYTSGFREALENYNYDMAAYLLKLGAEGNKVSLPCYKVRNLLNMGVQEKLPKYKTIKCSIKRIERNAIIYDVLVSNTKIPTSIIYMICGFTEY